MSHTAIAVDLDETLDVLRDITPQVTFHLQLTVDVLTNTVHLVFGEISYARGYVDAGGI